MNDSKINILVVEDDPTYLSFWERFLDHMGFSATCASTLAQMREKSADKKYNLIICDIVLPDGNGYELLKSRPEALKELPILFTTAFDVELSRFKLTEGNFHVLHKPFIDLNQLSRLVDHMATGKDIFSDAEEDSFSSNDDLPDVTEWTF